MAVLMKALQVTLKFESRLMDELKKKYEFWLLVSEGKDQVVHNLKES